MLFCSITKHNKLEHFYKHTEMAQNPWKICETIFCEPWASPEVCFFQIHPKISCISNFETAWDMFINNISIPSALPHNIHHVKSSSHLLRYKTTQITWDMETAMMTALLVKSCLHISHRDDRARPVHKYPQSSLIYKTTQQGLGPFREVLRVPFHQINQ